MAGESARDYARTQHEKAARHKRTAERYERGAAGELATAEALDPLRAQGWVVRHDVAWPARPRANIDHIAIGAGGVFVIDSKNWSGEVVVRDGALLQNGRSRERTVEAAAEAARAVSDALGGVPVTAVLCFNGDAALEGSARGVLVCSTGNVARLLTTRPPTLHADDVDRFARQAIVALPPATGPRSGKRDKPQAVTTTDTTTPTRRVVLRRTSRRRARSALIRLAVALVGLGALAVFAPGIGGKLTNLFTKGLAADETSVGEAVEVAGAGTRPDLSVKVASIDEVGKAAGRKPPQGHRLVAVRLRFENTGATRWVARRSPDISIETSDGRTFDADPRFSANAGGGAFPGKPQVKPGKALAGRAVVALPTNAKTKAVAVTLDATSGTIRWVE
ncbi:hypothetical protein ASG90_06700 [Nocardioides sp. Soil797]|nr:hypothetical protein ASG90_06700 [Nocardioides sp. Soil797]